MGLGSIAPAGRRHAALSPLSLLQSSSVAPKSTAFCSSIPSVFLPSCCRAASCAPLCAASCHVLLERETGFLGGLRVQQPLAFASEIKKERQEQGKAGNAKEGKGQGMQSC